MKLEEVKSNLGKIVHCVDERLFIDADYRFVHCILGKNDKGFYYRAEIQDLNNRSLIVTTLDKITAKEDDNAK